MMTKTFMKSILGAVAILVAATAILPNSSFASADGARSPSVDERISEANANPGSGVGGGGGDRDGGTASTVAAAPTQKTGQSAPDRQCANHLFIDGDGNLSLKRICGASKIQ